MAVPTALVRARRILTAQRPYLGAGLYSLLPVEKPGLGTMAVDQYARLYFDPEAIKKWSDKETVAVLYHELSHVIRGHSGRMKGVDHTVANYAGDMEINDDVRDEGFSLPEGCLFPSTYQAPDRLTAEEYVRYIPTQKQQQQSGGQGQGQSGSGGDDSKPNPGAGRCGSCATGKPEPWEDKAPSQGGGPGTEGAEMDIIRRQIAEAIKGRCDVPAGWKRWADSISESHVPWQSVLRSMVKNAIRDASGADDYTYRRLSRRRVSNVVLPGMYRPIPKVSMVIDTSGSMGDDRLSQALAEVDQVCASLGSEVYVLTVDADVHGGVQKVMKAKDVKLNGYGGTDMRVGIDAAIKTKPGLLVVLTDCETPWPDSPPSCPFLIVALRDGGHSHYNQTPSWARVVEVPSDAGR